MKNTPYSDKELKTFKKILKTQLAESKEELKGLKKLINDQNKYIASADMTYDSDASKIRNIEMLKNMRRRTKAKVQATKDALQRIKDLTYGLCVISGAKISRQRLMVMPEAPTCLKMAG